MIATYKKVPSLPEDEVGVVLQPANRSSLGAVQQALTGLPAGQRALQARQKQKGNLRINQERKKL